MKKIESTGKKKRSDRQIILENFSIHSIQITHLNFNLILLGTVPNPISFCSVDLFLLVYLVSAQIPTN